MNAPAGHPAAVHPPSRLLQLLEWRALWELGAGLAAWPWLQFAPRGDGHTVLVLPGLLASDTSTRLLRRFLAGRGYDVHGWGLGRNWGPRAGIEQSMLDKLDALAQRSGGRVSIVGQSLGGAYARWLATQRPDVVRFVITLGSPVRGRPHATRAARVYRFTSGDRSVQPERWKDVRRLPDVPTTSIYSRSDGIVPWQNSLEARAAHTENIEVVSSHVGMGAHPAVLYAVADRLAQKEDDWKPFDRRGWRAAAFPRPARRAG